MTGVPEMMNAMMQKLDKLERQNKLLHERIDFLTATVSHLRLPEQRQHIPRPIQGKEYGGDMNVTEFLHKQIQKLNETLLPNQKKFLDFPTDACLRTVQGTAMINVSLVLGKYLDRDYNRVVYDDMLYEMPRKLACVVEELKLMPEMSVYAQAESQWAIRGLIKKHLLNRQRCVERRGEPSGRKKPSKAVPKQISNEIPMQVTDNIFSQETTSRRTASASFRDVHERNTDLCSEDAQNVHGSQKEHSIENQDAPMQITKSINLDDEFATITIYW